MTHEQRRKADPKRQNLFVFPHKAFRFMWLEVVMEIGNGNYTTETGLKKTSDLLAFAIKNYTVHNHDESNFFAPRLKAKGGDAEKVVNEWVKEHDDHVAAMHNLDVLLKGVAAEPDLQKRSALNQDLYAAASAFLIEDLKHMKWEEEVVMGQFHASFTDAELVAMETDFLKQMDPAHMQELTPMFLRAGNIDDRIFMLSAIKLNAPPAAFEGVLHGLAPTIIPAAELDVIKQRLAAPPAAQP